MPSKKRIALGLTMEIFFNDELIRRMSTCRRQQYFLSTQFLFFLSTIIYIIINYRCRYLDCLLIYLPDDNVFNSRALLVGPWPTLLNPFTLI